MGSTHGKDFELGPALAAWASVYRLAERMAERSTHKRVASQRVALLLPFSIQDVERRRRTGQLYGSGQHPLEVRTRMGGLVHDASVDWAEVLGAANYANDCLATAKAAIGRHAATGPDPGGTAPEYSPDCKFPIFRCVGKWPSQLTTSRVGKAIEH